MAAAAGGAGAKMSKTYRSSAPPAADKQPEPLLYAAGSYLTPGRLGVQRVKAYFVVVLGLLVLGAGIVYADEERQPLLALAGLVLFGGAAIYSVTVFYDVERVRRQLWKDEEASGRDLDGDGAVGKPTKPAGHPVKLGAGSFVLPDLDAPGAEPPLPHFTVPANDVIYILRNVRQRPLTYRKWDKQRLPSGATVDRDLLTSIQDGLLAWRFAAATYSADGRRTVDLRTDIGVDAMIHAINKAIADNADKP